MNLRERHGRRLSISKLARMNCRLMATSLCTWLADVRRRSSCGGTRAPRARASGPWVSPTTCGCCLSWRRVSGGGATHLHFQGKLSGVVHVAAIYGRLLWVGPDMHAPSHRLGASRCCTCSRAARPPPVARGAASHAQGRAAAAARHRGAPCGDRGAGGWGAGAREAGGSRMGHLVALPLFLTDTD